MNLSFLKPSLNIMKRKSIIQAGLSYLSEAIVWYSLYPYLCRKLHFHKKIKETDSFRYVRFKLINRPFFETINSSKNPF